MRPNRVLYPRPGFSKDDAVDSYHRIARVLLPHLRGRPVSFKRYPDTIGGESFWEKRRLRSHPTGSTLSPSRAAVTSRTSTTSHRLSQNADYKTTIAPYSLRVKTDPPLVSMPVTWEEIEAADEEALRFEADAALARVGKVGDLFAPILKMKQKLPTKVWQPALRPARAGQRPGSHTTPHLPKRKSQSGRRLFVLPKTEMRGRIVDRDARKFRRWILRPDRDRGRQLIAVPAGQFAGGASHRSWRLAPLG